MNPLAVDLGDVLARTLPLFERLRGRRLFITGGTGFFGCWLLESLCWANDRLQLDLHASVLVRDAAVFRRRLPHLADHPAIGLIVGDVTTFAVPTERIDAVIHLAGVPDGPAYREQPGAMLDTLVSGTRRVAEAAAAWGATRFLYVSSGAVYGTQPADVERLEEDAPCARDPLAPRSLYGEGKRAAEAVAGAIGLAGGFDVIVARPFAFLGPYLPLDAGFAASEFLADALAGRPVRVAGDGSPQRTYLYAADLTVWLWTLLVDGQPGEAYNVGGAVPVTIHTLANTIASAVSPSVPVAVLGTPVADKPASRYVPDVTRANRLGLTETVNLSDAVRRTLAWYRVAPPRHPIISEDLASIVAAPLPWGRLAGKTVLVSGAAGFLPAYIVETILALNEKQSPATVIAMVRDRARAEARFASYRSRPDLQLLIQDVREPVPAAVRADFVIHAASPSSPKYYGQDPVGTIDANVRGTEILLELAKRSGAAAFLFLSSSEVYGKLPPDRVPTPEDAFGALDPTDVRSCYAESKRLGEALCAAYAAMHGVPAKIVRPFHTYGPGMRLDDGRVFADFVADVLAERPITLRSAGSSTRAFCYLADAVAGFFTVLFHGVPGRAYNVGDEGGEISIRNLAELVAGLFPDRGLTVRTEVREASDAYMASPVERSSPDTRRVRELGWKPTTNLADGFRRTIASYA